MLGPCHEHWAWDSRLFLAALGTSHSGSVVDETESNRSLALNRLVTLRTVLLVAVATAVLGAGLAIGVSSVLLHRDAGPAGRPGEPGPVGPAGADGADGEPGAEGAAGEQAELDEDAVMDVLRSHEDEVADLATDDLCSQLQLADSTALNDVALLGC